MSKKPDAASSGRSIVVLAASLVLVYTIFFGVKQPIEPLVKVVKTVSAGDAEPAPWAVQEAENKAVETELVDSGTSEIAQVQIAADTLPELIEENVPEAAQPTVDGKQFFSVQELFDKPAEVNQPDRVPLANTFEWIGTLRSIADYGLEDQVNYILKTNDNTHFVYLGKKQSIIVPNILQMGGSVVEIEGKNDINQHSLFGDRVMVLNSPQYDETYQKVIMIVFFAQTGDAWFVQVDRDFYEVNAEQIRATFDERYDR